MRITQTAKMRFCWEKKEVFFRNIFVRLNFLNATTHFLLLLWFNFYFDFVQYLFCSKTLLHIFVFVLTELIYLTSVVDEKVESSLMNIHQRPTHHQLVEIVLKFSCEKIRLEPETKDYDKKIDAESAKCRWNCIQWKWTLCHTTKLHFIEHTTSNTTDFRLFSRFNRLVLFVRYGGWL